MTNLIAVHAIAVKIMNNKKLFILQMCFYFTFSHLTDFVISKVYLLMKCAQKLSDNNVFPILQKYFINIFVIQGYVPACCNSDVL